MKILYRILKKDMIKKLESKNFGEQFIDTVMDAFNIPSNLMKKHYKNLVPARTELSENNVSSELSKIVEEMHNGEEGSFLQSLDDFPKDDLRVEGGRL